MSQVQGPGFENELRAICSLIDKRLEWEEKSRRRLVELELRLKEGQAAYNQMRDHCSYLGAIIADLDRTRLRLEFALGHATEHQWLLSHDLIQEKKRADHLEICLEKQYLVNEALLRAAAHTEHNGTSYWNIQHVLLENEWQRELIVALRSTLNAREETVRDLQVALEGEPQDSSLDYCCACDTESLSSEPETPLIRQLMPDSNNSSSTPRENADSSHRPY